MQKVITAAEMREVDRLTTEKYGIPSIILMENAAQAAARALIGEFGGNIRGKTAVILCGSGNNGGDGAALARILWTLGANCSVFLVGNLAKTKGDAFTNFNAVKTISEAKKNSDARENFLHFSEIPYDAIDEYISELRELEADVVIDALFGTGFSGSLRPPLDRLAALLRGRDLIPHCPLRVSVDLPSGLDADSGLIPGQAAEADLTITFTAPKAANVLPPASRCNGRLITAHIGSPQELIDAQPSGLFLSEKKDARKWLQATAFSKDSYKNRRGHAVIIAGSANYSGAAVLAANAAMRSGVGMVTLITPQSTVGAAASRLLPEVMLRGVAETTDGMIAEAAFDEAVEMSAGADAVAVGCGIGRSEETQRFVKRAVATMKCPMIIDADALTLLSPFAVELGREIEGAARILTPHEGEFLRLIGAADKDAIKDRESAVRSFAVKHGVILVLKGERVLIGLPDGRVIVNPTGNSGLGKAGNGDTLTGILAGFTAQAAAMRIGSSETVTAAVYVAGKAGDIAESKYGKHVMTASDVRECLAEAFAEIIK